MINFHFPSFLQTGDSEPLNKSLLGHVAQGLVKQYKYKIVRGCRDRVGVFCYIMRDPLGKRFYLIAKGSRLYRDFVSCQAYLPSRAERESCPIILAWLNPEDKTLRFYLFDPRQIVKHNYGLNDRQGVRMINFSIMLGALIEPEMSVEELYEKVKKIPRQTKLSL